MFKNKKTIYYIGAGAVVLAVIAYIQYKKFMDFELTFNSVKINKLNLSSINIDVFFNFINKSNIEVKLESQKYDIYFNDIYITTATNNLGNLVKANSTSVIGANINITDLKSIVSKFKGQGVLNLLTNLNTSTIKIVEKIKVKVYGIPYTVNYTYEIPLGKTKTQ